MLENTTIFCDLSATEREDLWAKAEQQTVAPGEMLFREGEVASRLSIVLTGQCMLSKALQPLGTATPYSLLDNVSVLGGLAHTMTAIATSACEVISWPLNVLWESAPFAQAARRYLAAALQASQTRLAELETPVHYGAHAALLPGPFLFDKVTMLIALCDADQLMMAGLLPPQLKLLRRPGRGRGSIFLAFANFPSAYPEARTDHTFAYDETTCFIPVRYGRSIGLYVPFIYSSSWEPILLGREIYGFPKQLGKTHFTEHSALLMVDGHRYLELQWAGTEASGEAQLVGALGSWIGFEGRLTTAAFRAGELLRAVMGVPPLRRVDVYNHKRVLATGATRETLTYDVDSLTRCVFGVLRWQQIEHLHNAQLHIGAASPLAQANLTLRAAFITQLDMRLSVGIAVNAN